MPMAHAYAYGHIETCKARKEASRRVVRKQCRPQMSFPGNMLGKNWYQKLILALASVAV